MLKVLLLGLVSIYPIASTAQTSSEQFSKADAAQDRGDSATAIADFLVIAFKGEQIGLPKTEIAEASYRLFDLSFRSGGVIDFDMATSFLEKAADAGHPAAQTHLSYLITRMFYDKPDKQVLAAIGGKYDLKDSLRLLKSATQFGHYPAYIQLADYYEKGESGALMDPAYAGELARKGVELALAAANAGDADAAIDLARYAEMGMGMPASDDQSRVFAALANQLLEDKALAGSVDAKRRLMHRLVEGAGGQSSPRTAGDAEYWGLEWVKGAGDYYSVTTVAGNYVDGEFAKHSNIIAHALYNYASTMGEGDYAANERDELAKRMTETELNAALSLARSCVETTLSECLSSLS